MSRGGTYKNDLFYNAPGYCFYVIGLPDTDVYQTEDSKSAHWDEDLNYLYPQVGDVYVGHNLKRIEFIVNEDPIEDTNFFDFFVDVDADKYAELPYDYNKGIGFIHRLNMYKNKLINDGYNVKQVSLLSLTDLDNLVKEISNERLPIKYWSDHFGDDVLVENNYLIETTFGDLKQYIPQKYKWLYSTTYWNSTLFKNPVTCSPGVPFCIYDDLYVFTAEQGKLCGAGSYFCAPTTAIGCGLRPILTIDSSDLIMKEDSNQSSEEPKEEPKQEEPQKESEEPKQGQEDNENNPDTGNSLIALCSVLLLFSVFVLCYCLPLIKRRMITKN